MEELKTLCYNRVTDLQDSIGFNMAAVTFLKNKVEENDQVRLFSDVSLKYKEKTFAGDRADQISYLLGQYEDMVDVDEAKSLGRIRVEGALEDDRNVTQFNVIWFSVSESINQRKSVDSSTRVCYVPVTTLR